MMPVGGWGDRDGRGPYDICEADRDVGGKDDSDVLLLFASPPPLTYRLLPLLLLLMVRLTSGSALWTDAMLR